MPEKRIDERDVLFARFDLTPVSARYRQYYNSHPERKIEDDEIRKFPDWFSPVHISKNPVRYSLAQAESDNLNNFLPYVKGIPAEKRIDLYPEKASAVLKAVLRYLGADKAGICKIDSAFLYSHVGRGPEPYGKKIPHRHAYAAAFSVKMEYGMIAKAPEVPVIVETGRCYNKAALISVIAADFLRKMGFDARAHIAGSSYEAMLVPIAWKAGLGELGRLGILMTPRNGPRIRLGLITTDLPMESGAPINMGMADFCRKCRKCSTNCPSRAIPSGKPSRENGVTRWIIDREACYRFWRKTGSDCAMCIYVCPYAKPDNLVHKSIRRIVRGSALSQSLAVRADDLFYGKYPRPHNRIPYAF